MAKYKKETMIGKKFGKLTVLGLGASRRTPGGVSLRMWDCLCDCGNRRLITTSNLARVLSCGCYRNERNKNQPKREKSSSWKGGYRIDGGYAFIYKPDHPKAKKNGYVRQHTLVMEQMLGRYLVDGENVHHKNGNKIDNRPQNLELWNVSQPSGQRVKDKLEWAREIIKLYG